MTFCLLPVHQSLYEKGSTLKGRNLLPVGTNSFFLGKTFFRRERNKFERMVSLESVSIPLKYFSAHKSFLPQNFADLGGSVGCAVRLETRRS